MGGRLQHFVEQWRSIGSLRRIVRWLARGYRLPFVQGGQAQALACRRRSCPKQLRIHYADNVKSKALEELIQSLLEKDVIEEIAKLLARNPDHRFSGTSHRYSSPNSNASIQQCLLQFSLEGFCSTCYRPVLRSSIWIPRELLSRATIGRRKSAKSGNASTSVIRQDQPLRIDLPVRQ